MRVITIRHRAALAWRSPPRLSRQRVIFPDDASMGATPQRCAHAGSDRRRSGLSPAAISRGGGGVGSHAEDFEQLGGGLGDEGVEKFVDGGSLGV